MLPTIEFITAASVTLGLAVSLIASIILLDAPRKQISAVTFALLSIAIAGIYSRNFFHTSGIGRMTLESTIVSCLALVIFLTLISLIFWPSARRIINLPIIYGAGLSACGAIALAFHY